MNSRFVLALFALCLWWTGVSLAYPVNQHTFSSLEGKPVYLRHLESSGWACGNKDGTFEKCGFRERPVDDPWQTDLLMKQVQYQGKSYWTFTSIPHQRSLCYSEADKKIDTCALKDSYPLGVRVDPQWNSLFVLNGSPELFSIQPATKQGHYVCSSPILKEWGIEQCDKPVTWALEFKDDQKWAKCQSYSGTGSHTVKACDRIVGENFKLRIMAISKDWVNYRLYADVAPGKQVMYSSTMGYKEKNKPFQRPFVSAHGANILMNKADDSSASVTVYNGCAEVMKACEAEPKEKSWICDANCSVQTPNPKLRYTQTDNVIVSMAKGYDRAQFLATQNARNCYAKTAELLGVEPRTPLSVAYAPTKDDKDVTGCSVGTIQDKVFCQISSKFSDKALALNKTRSAQMDAMLALTYEGKCVDYYDTPTYTMAHEMGHLFGGTTFPGLNHELGEGLATFIAAEAGSSVELDGLGNSNASTLLCGPQGYSYASNPTDIKPYETYSPSLYQQGSCLLSTLRDKYGDAKFKKMFEVMSRKPECVEIGQESSQFKMFSGFLNHLYQDDVLKNVGQQFKMSETTISTPCWE